MTPERWRQIEDLYHAALERAPQERETALAGVDPELRREVESLLARDGSMVDQPAWELRDPKPGMKVGAYEILGKLGQGGMGTVYRALDSRLNRQVAIKIMAEPFRGRFQREAQMIARLNHTNVCTLYDVGPDYLVMELIEGPTLAERIARGPVPLEEALRIARQIGEALEAAHEKGIVHRDLKPGNVKLRADGSVKVLDFGLAKVYAPPEGASPESSPTLTLEATRPGVIQGTAAYMSPEQAKGVQVDKRSDIWSFGVVLYELITGRRLFEGDTVSETLAGVLKTEVDLKLVPVKVRRLLAACLEKDPSKRLRDIGDAWRLLEEDSPTQTRSPATRTLPWVIASLAVLLAIGLGLFAMRGLHQDARKRVELSLLPPEGGTLHWNTPPAVSPDGRFIAFGAVVNGKNGIWLRELDSSSSRPLLEEEEVSPLAWSPDSRSIAFVSPNRTIKRVDLAGGPARTICDITSGFGGMSWGGNATIMFTDTRGTWRVPASGGTPTLVQAVDPATEIWHTDPWFLPDGQHFLVAITGKKPEDSAIYAGDIKSKDSPRIKRRILASSVASFTYSQGHLLYLRGQNLVAQTFDPVRLELTGEPVSIAEGVDNLQGWTRWGVSQTGVLAYTSGAVGLEQLKWFDRSGRILDSLGPAGMINTPAISPDGSTVAFDLANESISNDIWLHDLRRGSDSRFTAGSYRHPVWSSDGAYLAYNSRELAYQKSRSGGPDQKVGAIDVWDWSSDGRYMIGQTLNPKTRRDLWVIPLFRDRKPFAYLQTEFDELEGKFSPDVHWVAYASDETGRVEVYVQSFPNLSEKFQVSSGGGDFPVWSRDGKELFFVSADSKMMAAEVRTTGGRFQASVPRALFATRLLELSDVHDATPYDVSRDGRFLLVTPQWTPGRPITVVMNWNAGWKN